MARLYSYYQDYRSWLKELEPYNNVKRISPNTVITLDYKTQDILVELHGYNIIRHHPDNTFTLDACGWYTHTTKKRISQFSPVNLYQKNFDWFVEDAQGKVPFFNGIKIDMCGNVLNR